MIPTAPLLLRGEKFPPYFSATELPTEEATLPRLLFCNLFIWNLPRE